MNHRTQTLASAWDHEAPTKVTAFSVDDADRSPTLRGRASVIFETGSFELRLRATPTDLRALAQMLLATAENQDAVNHALECTL